MTGGPELEGFSILVSCWAQASDIPVRGMTGGPEPVVYGRPDSLPVGQECWQLLLWLLTRGPEFEFHCVSHSEDLQPFPSAWSSLDPSLSVAFKTSIETHLKSKLSAFHNINLDYSLSLDRRYALSLLKAGFTLLGHSVCICCLRPPFLRPAK